MGKDRIIEQEVVFSCFCCGICCSGYQVQMSVSEAHRIADFIAEEDIRCVVVNMEHAAFDQGLAQALADHLNAPFYTLSEIKAETLYHTVREQMDSARSP